MSQRQVKLLRKSSRAGLLEEMIEGGKLLSSMMSMLTKSIQVNMTTRELNSLFEKMLEERGLISSFKGWYGYPDSLCVSINSEVVHGMPSTEKRFKTEQLIKLDIGLRVKSGYCLDMARTFYFGGLAPVSVQRLLDTTKLALRHAEQISRAKTKTLDIAKVISETVHTGGFSPYEAGGGHGIGINLWEAPTIANSPKLDKGEELTENSYVCIEPIVALFRGQYEILPDKWTVVNVDKHNLVAHFEDTFYVMKDRLLNLTKDQEVDK